MSLLVSFASFVTFIEKTYPIIKFCEAFNHLLQTCEVAKSWRIKLYYWPIDVIHVNEQTKYVNCGLYVNFFCKCHFPCDEKGSFEGKVVTLASGPP